MEVEQEEVQVMSHLIAEQVREAIMAQQPDQAKEALAILAVEALEIDQVLLETSNILLQTKEHWTIDNHLVGFLREVTTA